MDAIGNTLQGPAAVRAPAQQSVPRTAQQEADPTAGAAAEPSRYFSPVVRLDSETQRTVLQYRDGSDGKVLVQYPSEKQLEAYRNRAIAERSKEQEQADATKPARQGEPIRVAFGQPSAGVSEAEPAGGIAASASPVSGPAVQAIPIGVPTPSPRLAGSGGGAAFGVSRPLLNSISA
ncbi:hypothetical protein JL100_024645 [Skermanella mucosa]|uniref:hypothetical protein n=1 Tax=Skermanella mucosa TaxID=1789672 RepID=UPI00192C8C40|nr:hypothetical protein [Skermanella mucosa]UEM20233.1 hypothetical protein JL100_024645 [Skermanella mucosa]